MSDSDGCDVNCTCTKCKGKKRVIRIEETSDSDSPVENASRKKKVLRVLSDGAVSSSESDSFYEVARKKKRRKIPRVMSDEEDNCRPVKSNRNRLNGITSEVESSSGDDESDSGASGDSESDDFEYVGNNSSSSSGWQSDWASHDEEVYDIPDSPASAPELSMNNNGCDSDSSDGSSEKCPICLRSLKSQEIGTPEACEHQFCVMCLQEWAKNVNTCPVDRKEFTQILVRRHLGGSVSRRIAVEPPVKRDHDDDIVEDPTFCEACQSSDREDRMLLCDGCDSGYHLECLNPPLGTVPVEEWFCPECVASNSQQMSGEVDMGAEELIDLIDDAQNTIGFSPLRPRVQRLLPRTRASERVRATIRTRVRTEAANQPSTSSGIESQESASRLAGFFGGRGSTGAKKPVKRRMLKKTKARRKTKSKKSKVSGVKKKSTSGQKSTTVKKRKTFRRKKVDDYFYSESDESFSDWFY